MGGRGREEVSINPCSAAVTGQVVSKLTCNLEKTSSPPPFLRGYLTPSPVWARLWTTPPIKPKQIYIFSVILLPFVMKNVLSCVINIERIWKKCSFLVNILSKEYLCHPLTVTSSLFEISLVKLSKT